MAELELDCITKSFGATAVLKGVSLRIADGAFVVLLGPSGCGKTTLLRIIAGLEDPDDGEVRIGGVRMNETAPAHRGAAMVFQSYALYPHKSVFENMAFGLRMAGVRKAEIERRVGEAAAMLHLSALLDRRPRQLSGGQRQRVAIGRAVVRTPGLFLFDEPLSNLDAGLRAQMRFEIARLHRELLATMVYVTHDQVEAMTLADVIVVMNEGRIEQAGSPRDLYKRPASRFVAAFLGSPQMNFLPVQAVARPDGGVDLRGPGDLALPAPQGIAPGARLELGLRPESLHLDGAGPLKFHGVVKHAEYLGATTFVHVELSGAPGVTLVGTCSTGVQPRIGSGAMLAAPAESVHLFTEDGAAVL